MELAFELRGDSICSQGSFLALLVDRTAGHGGVLWDASLILAHAVSATSSLLPELPELRVLELGAGCGLPGLALAVSRPCRVTLTDRSALVPLLEYNVGLNSPLISARGSTVCTAVLEFGQRLKRLPASARPPYDVVLASDVLGCSDVGAFDALMKTLSDIFATGTSSLQGCTVARPCTILMTYRPRAPWEDAFFEDARARGWGVRLVRRWTPSEVAGLKSQLLRCGTAATNANTGGAGTAQLQVAAGSEDCVTTIEGLGAMAEVSATAGGSVAFDIPGTESSPSTSSESRWGSGEVELWALTPT